jgi:hypothetical protein
MLHPAVSGLSSSSSMSMTLSPYGLHRSFDIYNRVVCCMHSPKSVPPRSHVTGPMQWLVSGEISFSHCIISLLFRVFIPGTQVPKRSSTPPHLLVIRTYPNLPRGGEVTLRSPLLITLLPPGRSRPPDSRLSALSDIRFRSRVQSGCTIFELNISTETSETFQPPRHKGVRRCPQLVSDRRTEHLRAVSSPILTDIVLVYLSNPSGSSTVSS